MNTSRAGTILCSVVICVATLQASAGELPKGWFRNTWGGYKPYAKIETVEGPLPGLEAIKVTDVASQHGFAILSTTHHPAVEGDRMRVSFLGRGKGRASVGYVSFTAEDKWNQIGASKSVDLTDDWNLFECELTVSDRMFPKKTGAVQPSLLGSTGSACWFSDVRTEIVKAGQADGGFPEIRELRDRKVSFHEDFEKPSGGVETLLTDVAPGLLHKTKIGVFRTGDRMALPCRTGTVSVPSGRNGAFSVGGRLYSLKGELRTVLRFGAREIILSQRAIKSVNTIECEIRDGGRAAYSFRVPRRILPADFRLDLNAAGGWAVDVNSLSDSSSRHYGGLLASPPSGSATVGWELVAEEGANAGAAVDELETFASTVVGKSRDVPYRIDRFAEFDPVKAGWTLVFEDEFEGNEIDWSKWYFPHYAGNHKDCVHTDGQGHLVVEAKDDGTGKLVTDGIWSTTALEYGYFEARLKFTEKPGWWAAFWLYGTIDSNPFIDGFEIDVFEDYYTRPRETEGTPRATLDHNNHVTVGPTLKSWNFNSQIPGDRNGWHVIACKWTPFEISYYMDGKIIPSKAGHGAYDSVTFDAIHHFAGITPLHAICSGQVHRRKPKDFDLSAFPERFLIDRVRLYAYPRPDGEFPTVGWGRGTDEKAIVPAGSMLHFKVDAAPAKSGTRIAAAYLFDNGFLIGHRTEPPYDFDVRFSSAAYEHTNYMKPGRSGQKPEFDGYSHVFVAYVQDESGRTSHTEPLWRIPAKVEPHPFEGVAAKIPGRISSIRFDEGGRGVSQYTRDGRNKHWAPTRTNDTVTAAKSGYVGTLYGGDWLNYTVDVAAAGPYEVKAMVGTGVRQRAALRLFLDGRPLGRLALDSFTSWKRGEADDCGSAVVTLPAGRHVLTVGIEGGVSFRHIEFSPVVRH